MADHYDRDCCTAELRLRDIILGQIRDDKWVPTGAAHVPSTGSKEHDIAKCEPSNPPLIPRSASECGEPKPLDTGEIHLVRHPSGRMQTIAILRKSIFPIYMKRFLLHNYPLMYFAYEFCSGGTLCHIRMCCYHITAVGVWYSLGYGIGGILYPTPNRSETGFPNAKSNIYTQRLVCDRVEYHIE